MQAARSLGSLFAKSDIELVYGGAQVGLMGAIADASLEGGGRVTGVMPKALVEKEIEHKGLTELIITDDMHGRKQTMADIADGFIAMPGGAGTLEEIYEQWTWAQLGIHKKACAFLNINGFYDPVRVMAQQSAKAGFMKQHHADMLIFSSDPDDLIQQIHAYSAPEQKWQ